VGRPRNAAADQAILDATRRLLVQQGYDGMSMEAVASAAGVGKPTIYRRYPNKRELVIAAVSCLAESMPPPPNTRDVRADLLRYLESAFGVFQSGLGFATLGALLVKERDDPELLALFRSNVVLPRMQVLVELLHRGIRDHQVRRDAPVDIAVQMLAGAMFAHHVVGQPFDAVWLRGLVDTLWRGMSPEHQPLVIREVLPAEHAEAARVTIDGYASDYGEDLGYYAAHLGDIAGRVRDAAVLVALVDGQIAATVTYVQNHDSPLAEHQRSDEASIRMLSVAPSHRRQGLARALTEACIARARTDGKRRVALHADEAMQPARRLYEGLGFQRDPERDYAPDAQTWLHAYVLDL
jgi:AcrR family transcriptional regulator